MTVPNPPYDALDIAVDLIRCPSVTPLDEGALGTLANYLAPLGFNCERMHFSEEGTPDVDNLYARIGSGSPHFCFAGHTDVVPVGDADKWTVDPFGGEIKNGMLFGRGAADMKGSIASFVAAASRLVREGKLTEGAGSISLLITGDEEGPSVNGTIKMLKTLKARGETFDHCLVGEPTCVSKLGDMMKIGRRGSINGWLTVHGVAGHVAYPHQADNPLPRMMEMLRRLNDHTLDKGNDHFQPSNYEVTTIDTGNTATNVIPGTVRAVMNIRFNDEHSGASLEQWMRGVFDQVTQEMGGSYEFETKISGESFITAPGEFSALIADAIKDVTGEVAELSTTGGTSDARFIRSFSPVVEFGFQNATMHKVDEHVPVAHFGKLTDIYEAILRGYFKKAPTS